MKHIIYFITYLIIYNSLIGDTLTLKSGKVYENVKTKIKKDSILVMYPDSKEIRYSKSEVKSIIIKPVFVKIIKTNHDKVEIENEKIRVAEILQDTSEFEIDPEKKLQLAVLNFEGGKNIPEEELDLLEDLMTTNLVKTKLFIILERNSINKLLEEKAGKNCTISLINCSLKMDAIGKILKSPKLLTTNVKLINKKYYISGNIVDANKNSIDFAETVTADNPEKFPEAISLFSKKLAGGLTEYSEQELITKGSSQFRYPNELKLSAIVPGLGQWKKNDKPKSILIFSSSLLSILFFVSNYNSYRNKKEEFDIYNTYSTLGFTYSGLGFYYYNQSKNLESELAQSSITVFASSLLLGAIYIYNLYDAYFTKDKRVSKTSGFNIQFENKITYIGVENNYALSYTFTF
jgi:hypothetical protein